MGKKKPRRWRSARSQFVNGARRGVDEPRARHHLRLDGEVRGYGFNKSHAAAYALIAYPDGVGSRRSFFFFFASTRWPSLARRATADIDKHRPPRRGSRRAARASWHRARSRPTCNRSVLAVHRSPGPQPASATASVALKGVGHGRGGRHRSASASARGPPPPLHEPRSIPVPACPSCTKINRACSRRCVVARARLRTRCVATRATLDARRSPSDVHSAPSALRSRAARPGQGASKFGGAAERRHADRCTCSRSRVRDWSASARVPSRAPSTKRAWACTSTGPSVRRLRRDHCQRLNESARFA
jgi:hypothetical protein